MPVPTVPHVDIDRFMGSWYVIAAIPTRLEKGAYDAIETYGRAPDGTIDTRFSYFKDGFDGKYKVTRARGYVRDGTSNAVWGMQFIWPIKADYRISYLSPDYGQTVVAREKRDYLWIMARTPRIPDADLQAHIEFARRLGYDPTLIKRIPQSGRTRQEDAAQRN